MAYEHPVVGIGANWQLNNLHTAMDRNSAGEPILRIGAGGTPGVDSVAISAGGVGGDAFGRLRISEPFTLFDSSHRFADNGEWVTSNTALTSATFNSDEGVINLTVPTTTGTSVLRETKKVFSYQPGKSLLNMNTFVMAPAQANLTQRVGYFGAKNGIYVQLQDSTVSFVERSSVTGSMAESVVAQTNWNIDKMDGAGPSGLTLNISGPQILWMDIEWLGLGTVRIGFVIDGKLIHCHSFHHANLVQNITTYITTASLPLRYEIINDGGIASPATLKQICSSVVSEGGYDLVGTQYAVGTPIATPKAIPNNTTLVPVVGIRLKTTADRLDAVVIPSAMSFMGTGNGIAYQWKILQNATITGGIWASIGTDSSVEYNTGGTAVTGGRILASGFINSSNQSTPSVNLPKEALFKFQLERNSFTNTAFQLVLAVEAGTATTCYGSLDWEEVTR